MANFTLEPVGAPTAPNPKRSFSLTPVIPGDGPSSAAYTGITTPPRVSVMEEKPFGWKPEKPLTRDDILNTPEYMAIVRNAMKARFGVENRMGVALDYQYDETLSDEDIFEMWQNYNRSFAAGQTVTTGAEVAFHQRANEEDKRTVGQSYMLFDNMANIFSEDISWGEFGEGLFDYARAAVWDPATLLGMGIGRAVGATSTKVTSAAIRQAAMASYRTALKKGVSKEVARQAAKTTARTAFKQLGKEVAVNTGKLAALDLPFAIGADVGYQYSRLEAGAQEEWSKMQTGFSALGAMVLPATVASFKGVQAIGKMKGADKLGVQNYIRITEELKGQMNPQAINAAVIRNMDKDIVQSEMGVLASDMERVLTTMGNWADDLSNAAVNAKNLSIDDQKQIFWDTFFFGDETQGVKGLIASLNDAGVSYVPRGPEDKVTNFLGDIIKELPKEHFDNISKVLGDNPNLMPEGFKTMGTEEIGSYFKKMTSNAGRTLARMSVANRRLASKKPLTVGDILEGVGYQTAKETVPERLKYAQGVYKRLLTAHPGTTGLNVKGWSITTAANTISDVVAGTLLGAGGNFKGARGSILGAMRRGYNVLNHVDTVEAAADYLATKPELRQKLFQHIAGGVDQAGSRKEMFTRYGLDPDSALNNRVESVTNALQVISGVKIQDEITKMLSFMSALDQELMKTVGMGYNKFMQQDDAWVKTFGREFARIEQKALERTLRETYSMPQNITRARTPVISDIAHLIERVSNTPGTGVLIPFGQFFNNATATLGDYTMLNFIRYAARKGAKNTDIDTDDLVQLFAKGAVGLSALALYFTPHEEEKMDMGLRWNQELNSDGSITDLTYDAPIPYMKVLGRVLAHLKKDGEIPPDLKVEAARILGGQLTRDIAAGGDAINQFGWEALSTLFTDTGEIHTTVGEFLMAAASRPVSGALRPLDPINQISAMLTDSFDNPDRRQGIEAVNNMFRYVDQVFGSTSPEERRQPFNTPAPQDIGRLTGNRQAQPPSVSERMLASMGKSPWSAIRWSGENPQLKNAMDKTIEPIINMYAEDVLEKHPTWFNMSLAAREKIWREQVAEPAKEDVKNLIKSDLLVDPIMSLHLTIAGHNQREVERAREYWGIEGKLEDLTTDQLKLMIEYLQNPDDHVVK